MDAVKPNNELSYTRGYSVTSSPRHHAFHHAVRERDQGCAITQGPFIGRWTGHDAAHIVPLAFKDLWVACSFNNQITRHTSGENQPMNSVQNGLFMRQDIHSFLMHMIFRYFLKYEL